MCEQRDAVRGTVFNIQHFSIHDGPGIRTTVFVKGCPLRCLWCSNPESQEFGAEILYFPDLCTACGACVRICPSGARTMRDLAVHYHRASCRTCGLCSEHCPAKAVRLAGTVMTVDDVMGEVERDRLFYEESGGGITVSGGEPASQPAFSAQILKKAREAYIHTAVETSGFAAWTDLLSIVIHSDLVLFDLKHPDPMRHRELTGYENGPALENARKIAERGYPIILRVPLIPGINDRPDDIDGFCRLADDLKVVREIDLLPYHEYGRSKYRGLGREYPMAHCTPLAPDAPVVISAAERIRKHGFEVIIGG